MTEVRLTPTALEYVRNHGKNVMVIHGYRSGCCGGRVRVPSAAVGVPNEPSKYRKTKVADCVIWLPVDLGLVHIEIDVAKLWKFEKLMVKAEEI